MLYLLSFSLVSAIAVHLLLFRLAVPLGLVDIPNERKTHTGSIPVFGGLAIYLSTAVSVIIFDIQIPLQSPVLLFTLVLFLFGLIDDRMGLSPKLRIIAQMVIALLSVLIGDLHLYFFGDIFGVGDFYLGFKGEILTVLAIVTAINAFNMIDGIDGLLASLLIILFSIFIWIDMANAPLYGVLLINLAVFLLFNLDIFSSKKSQKRVFMGDAGSMAFGYFVVALLLDKSQMPNIEIRPVTVLWLLAVPLMDLIAIVIRRLRKGQPLMEADREHLHHIFMRMGFSERRALFVISSVAIVFACIGLVCEYLKINETLIFFTYIGIFLVYLFFILHAWRVVRKFNLLRRKSRGKHAKVTD